MNKEPYYYKCDLPYDMSMYDHLPYHVNPNTNDGSNIHLCSGNILRGYPINYYVDKTIDVPNGEDE